MAPKRPDSFRGPYRDHPDREVSPEQMLEGTNQPRDFLPQRGPDAMQDDVARRRQQRRVTLGAPCIDLSPNCPLPRGLSTRLVRLPPPPECRGK
jgi:hypothetical protein